MEQMDEIVKGLFITEDNQQINRTLDPWRDFLLKSENEITNQEVINAVKRIRKKSTGPDGITMGVLKWISTQHLEHITWLLNGCFKNGIVPEQWKIGRLVLIPKKLSGCSLPSHWRPLCVLSNWAKVYEHVIKGKLMKKIKHVDNQYGFCRKKSTVDAMENVMTVWRKARKAGKFCLLVTLDVRNAFNTLRWSSVNRCIKARRINHTLSEVISDYLKDRKICYTLAGNYNEWAVFGGVPQGSVLGPTLWNIVYDELLSTMLPKNVYMVGYADDVSLVLTSHSMQTLTENLTTSMTKISKWFRKEGLSLAEEKTEVVLLTSKKVQGLLTIPVLNKPLAASEAVKYLGVLFGGSKVFRAHVKNLTERALKTAGGLARIMPNHGGGGVYSRTLYYRTIESIVLYGAPIWHTAAQYKINISKLRTVQRTILARVTRAYRTTSTDALCVLSGFPPWELLIEERARLYRRLKNEDAMANNGRNKLKIQREERDITLTQWQTQWDSSRYGRKTYKLISDIRGWIGWGPKVLSHHLTQILTGHGCFGTYKFRIGKAATAACWLCDWINDDMEHTLFNCSAWQPERRELSRHVGPLNPDNLMMLLQDEKKRQAILNFISSIMNKKIAYERLMDKQGRIPQTDNTSC